LGQAFSSDRSAVFASIQRLRAQSRDLGTLKTTPQQEVETRTTESGQQVIVIEPANPQSSTSAVRPQVVYTQPRAPRPSSSRTTTTATAAVAGVVGFAPVFAIGAAIDNDYYYGPRLVRRRLHVQRRVGRLVYDDREDAREDWYDNREERGRTGRTIVKTWPGSGANARAPSRNSAPSGSRRARRAGRSRRRSGSSAAPRRRGPRSRREVPGAGTRSRRGAPAPRATSARYSRGQSQATSQRSGTRSDAFSGYSSGKAERSASAPRRAAGAAREAAGVAGDDGGSRQASPQNTCLEETCDDVRTRAGRWTRIPHVSRIALAVVLLASMLASVACRGCGRAQYRSFATPEEAVRVLHDTVKAGDMEELLAISSARRDGTWCRRPTLPPAGGTARSSCRDGRGVAARGSRTDAKELVIGNEDWPFRSRSSRRRAGGASTRRPARRRCSPPDRRNELAVIRVCQTYVNAQRAYASAKP